MEINHALFEYLKVIKCRNKVAYIVELININLNLELVKQRVNLGLIVTIALFYLIDYSIFDLSFKQRVN